MRETDALGIRPTVDFAFKKIFGSPEHSQALIGLLNAILRPEPPIAAVEILNPFSYQEFVSDKQVVLDIRARDAGGRWINVEMQVAIHSGLLERLIYYACRLFVDQLTTGDNYVELCPAISICLIDGLLFRDTEQAHHRFELTDDRSGRRLPRGIAVHTLELGKYNLDGKTISGAAKLEQWVYLFLWAHEHTADELRRLLPGVDFADAIAVIETIAQKTQDLAMYNDREKAQRDHQWALAGARQDGLEEGREEGRKEGRLAGRVQLLQELLGEVPASDDEILALSTEQLAQLVGSLQTRLRNRNNNSP